MVPPIDLTGESETDWMAEGRREMRRRYPPHPVARVVGDEDQRSGEQPESDQPTAEGEEMDNGDSE